MKVAENELLNVKKILLESLERGEDLTDFSTLSETTKNAFHLLCDFFRDRPDNVSRHFWEYKKELSYHRFSDKQDDEHLYVGARLLYRQFLVALTDCVDLYFSDYAGKVQDRQFLVALTDCVDLYFSDYAGKVQE